ncbi:MAG: hypothetical protein M3R25_00045 [Bacteroidota bacterium]|nr:hypothetical protein [Bacteroidota bacterium]
MFLFFAILLQSTVVSQGVNLGTPPIWNYSRKIYSAGTQNWDATQDNNNLMYWANNEGLLRFDGTSWFTFPVSNHTIVRSITFDGINRIYAGAQGELGYFTSDAKGELTYTSLTNLLPEEQRNFEDVWDIVFYEKNIYFRTNKSVFEFNGTSFRSFNFDGHLDALLATPAGLLLQQEYSSLLKYEDKSFKPWLQIATLQSAITGIFPWNGDTSIYSTLKHGLFYLTGHQSNRWLTSIDQILMEKRIYSATPLKDGQIALGTSLDGLIVMDQKRVYRHLNKKDGLQNNNILNTFCDKAGNLWLGLDNGIDCVVLDSKFTTIYPDNELQATAYAASVYDNQLYLGVSNGAYVVPWQPYYNPELLPYFKRVANAEGQVWSLSQIGDDLMMGHHEGAYKIANGKAEKISTEQGSWTYVVLSDDYMIGGTYTGLVLYQKKNGQWTFDGRINGIHESCRIMVRDADGSVWISHPYRGLYKVDWSAEKKYDPVITFYDQSSGLPTNLNNYVFQITGRAVFGTEKGVYFFDKNTNHFEPDSSFNQMIGADHRVKLMKEDAAGNIWYVTDQEVGLLEINDFGLRKEAIKKIFPELQGKLVGGFEMIYPIDQDYVLFGAEEGFILYNNHPESSGDTTLHLVFNGIRAIGTQDSLLFGGYAKSERSKDAVASLDPYLNNLSFSYSATEFKTPNLIQYRTKLEGLEKKWSQWSSETRRDLTNLSPGLYKFFVQAKIKDGIESDFITYSFIIRPPWYKTKTALAFYGIGFISLFAGLILRQKKKFESEKTLLTLSHLEKEAQHIRAVEQSKAALSEIQNEKLEVEIKYKNQELATTTLHLVQKAEILLTVQESLNQIRKKNKDAAVNKEIQHLLNLLNFDVKLDEDWEHFAHHFDQVHVDFLKQLRDHFPQLSASDFKLCAYLRMNLSTKEIAPLLNISVRGVEGSRYRLRKKLNLPNDANLTEFILGLPVSKN